MRHMNDKIVVDKFIKNQNLCAGKTMFEHNNKKQEEKKMAMTQQQEKIQWMNMGKGIGDNKTKNNKKIKKTTNCIFLSIAI